MSKSSEKLENVSNRVSELRRRLGLTQDELAQRLGVSGNYVYMIEKGRIPGKKFVEKLRELEQPSESGGSNPLVVREEFLGYNRQSNEEGLATANRLRLDAQTLRVMANRLETEAAEIEKRHSRY